jgi:hypothetical protein
MEVIIAAFNGRKTSNAMKLRETITLEKKFVRVDAQTSFLSVFSDSLKICMPKESEILSANAIISIPPMMLPLACGPEWSPAIKPRFVIIADVDPKLNLVRWPLSVFANFLNIMICIIHFNHQIAKQKGTVIASSEGAKQSLGENKIASLPLAMTTKQKPEAVFQASGFVQLRS